jgi:hypothetical protein
MASCHRNDRMVEATILALQHSDLIDQKFIAVDKFCYLFINFLEDSNFEHFVALSINFDQCVESHIKIRIVMLYIVYILPDSLSFHSEQILASGYICSSCFVVVFASVS